MNKNIIVLTLVIVFLISGCSTNSSTAETTGAKEPVAVTEQETMTEEVYVNTAWLSELETMISKETDTYDCSIATHRESDGIHVSVSVADVSNSIIFSDVLNGSMRACTKFLEEHKDATISDFRLINGSAESMITWHSEDLATGLLVDGPEKYSARMTYEEVLDYYGCSFMLAEDWALPVYPDGISGKYVLQAEEPPEIIYTTPAEENGLKYSVYYLVGTVVSYTAENDTTGLNYFILETEQGKVVVLDYYGLSLDIADDKAPLLTENDVNYDFPPIGERIKVYCVYLGFSGVMDMPALVYGVPDSLAYLIENATENP